MGLQCQRGIVIGDGGIERAGLEMHKAARRERGQIVWTQPKRLFTILQSFLEKPERCPRPTAIVERRGVAGVEIDDLAVVLNGTTVVALAKKRRSSVGKCLGKVLWICAPGLDDGRAAADLPLRTDALAAGAPRPCRRRLRRGGAGADALAIV